MSASKSTETEQENSITRESQQEDVIVPDINVQDVVTAASTTAAASIKAHKGSAKRIADDDDGDEAESNVEMKKKGEELSREELFAVLRQQKIDSTQARISQVQKEISLTKEKIEVVKAELKSPDARATVKQHINLLHKYNEIRDIGQGLMGMVADARNVPIREVYADYGVEKGD